MELLTFIVKLKFQRNIYEETQPLNVYILLHVACTHIYNIVIGRQHARLLLMYVISNYNIISIDHGLKNKKIGCNNLKENTF